MEQDRKELPIAIFDSGVGGLSVFRAVSQLLPSENIVYLADSKRAPYGDKTPAEIVQCTGDAVSCFKQMKLLVIACHTSSAHCLEGLQKKLPIPVIGVIQGAIQSIRAFPHFRRLGVLGTQSTIASGVYQAFLRSWNSQVEVYPIACPKFVPLIEGGFLDHPEIARAAQQYVEPFKKESVDAVLLACTHYPLIRSVIQKYAGENVPLIEASERTAFDVKEVLQRGDLLRESGIGKHHFYVTGAPEKFAQLAKLFLKVEINPKLR